MLTLAVALVRPTNTKSEGATTLFQAQRLVQSLPDELVLFLFLNQRNLNRAKKNPNHRLKERALIKLRLYFLDGENPKAVTRALGKDCSRVFDFFPSKALSERVSISICRFKEVIAMFGHRGAMFGSGGVSDGYKISSKRPRMMESNPYFAVSSGSSGYQPYGYGSRYPPSAFPVVHLRGLPFNCSDTDIFKFFAGLDIVDVFLVNKDGRFSGEAFVVFAGPMQADLALQRDRQNMGRRYVEVFRCKKQEYYHAIAAEVNEGCYGNIDLHGTSSPA
ncbi:putative RNA-binding protein (RRM superfamily) [Forsythia ovata]|uniref:RNA-binding protein (RRM superfamily) n=1 Tax=Forsythia ovata TaxID=205694 RepID=A0ABD1UBA2_9LAMI